jgi:hypothetical protein
MYEILAQRPPYTQEEANEFQAKHGSFAQAIRAGCRPVFPSIMPIDQRTLLSAAWDADPDKRPSMETVVEAVDSFEDIGVNDSSASTTLSKSGDPIARKARLAAIHEQLRAKQLEAQLLDKKKYEDWKVRPALRFTESCFCL